MTSLHAIIMAGGSGTRFWPASRASRPKQFLPLAHGVPLLQATIDRLAGLCNREQVWIVTNATQAAALPNLLPDFPRDHILVEPEARDTAPCIALATATIASKDPHATMLVLPADHVIEPVDRFQAMLRRGITIAQDDETLVTFGVPPTYPATGYGYVECGDPLDAAEPRAFAARRFREKPALPVAQQFLASGGFLWNSGIFVWTVPAIRAAMANGNAALAKATDAMLAAIHAGDAVATTAAFQTAPKISIDYAILEHAKRIAVVEATVRWDDVGTFPALASVGARDADGNHAVLTDGASQLTLQSQGNLTYAEGKRTIALFGVQDLVVVAVGDAVMVCPKDRADDLKALVDHVRAQGRTDLL